MLIYDQNFLQLQKAKTAVKSYEDRMKDTENEQNDDLESSLIQLEEERQRYAEFYLLSVL